MKGKGIKLLALVSLVSACGAKQEDESSLLWQQSRTNSTRYAYLESRDLTDSFLFGMQVMNTTRFFASALNMNFPSTPVKLERDGNKINVLAPNFGNEKLLAFDARLAADDKLEVDFASAGNDLSLKELVEARGGAVVTEGDDDSAWVSEGAPQVLSIQQTPDLVIADIKYLVSGYAKDDNDNRVEKSGEVVVRIFLVRRSSLSLRKAPLTIGQGKSDNFGYFSSSLTYMLRRGNVDADPIRKFNLSQTGTVTYHLKGFPADQLDNAKSAVLDWNNAFGREAVKVVVAADHVDIADPRYNVVKWIQSGDDFLSWAGTAGPTFDDPATGTVISGGTFINGDYLVEKYRRTHNFSQNVGRFVTAAIGNARFTPTNGEAPVLPYSTIANVDFPTYIKGYYNRTINHELGHIFGLRHNFKGTIGATSDDVTNSVMDYLPRVERALGSKVGRYDREAIRWGYSESRFRGQHGFCTDENLATTWDCLQNDVGNPITHTNAAIRDGVAALALAPAETETLSDLGPLTSVTQNALKILALKAQLSATDRAEAVRLLPDAADSLCQVQVAAHLSPKEKAVASANLAAAKKELKKALSGDTRGANTAAQLGILRCL